jgi:hypothetical protein
MKLKLSTFITTPELSDMLSSIGAAHLLAGNVYSPLMQVLIAPTDDKSEALPVWELMQKLYANKDGEVELTDAEVKLLKSKLSGIAFPWLKVRLEQVLNGVE